MSASPTDEERPANCDVLNEEIDKRTQAFSSAELVEQLNEAGVPAGPIYTIDQMFADPQVKHLKMAIRGPSPRNWAVERDRSGHQHERTPLRP